LDPAELTAAGNALLIVVATLMIAVNEDSFDAWIAALRRQRDELRDMIVPLDETPLQ